MRWYTSHTWMVHCLFAVCPATGRSSPGPCGWPQKSSGRKIDMKRSHISIAVIDMSDHEYQSPTSTKPNNLMSPFSSAE